MSSAVTLSTVLTAQQVLEEDAQRVRQAARIVDHGVEAADAVALIADGEIGPCAERVERHAGTLPLRRARATLGGRGWRAAKSACRSRSNRRKRPTCAAVVTIGGELEYGTAGPLRTTLLELSQRDADALVLDMRAVEFLDSTGISLLIQAKQRFDAQGLRFVLRHPPPRVTAVLEIAGVAELFTIES